MRAALLIAFAVAVSGCFSARQPGDEAASLQEELGIFDKWVFASEACALDHTVVLTLCEEGTGHYAYATSATANAPFDSVVRALTYTEFAPDRFQVITVPARGELEPQLIELAYDRPADTMRWIGPRPACVTTEGLRDAYYPDNVRWAPRCD